MIENSSRLTLYIALYTSLGPFDSEFSIVTRNISGAHSAFICLFGETDTLVLRHFSFLSD